MRRGTKAVAATSRVIGLGRRQHHHGCIAKLLDDFAAFGHELGELAGVENWRGELDRVGYVEVAVTELIAELVQFV